MEMGFHQPVLRQASIQYLLTGPGGVYVDCTLGGGGHSEAFLAESAPGGFVIGLDADPYAIAFATERLKAYPNKLIRQTFYDQIDVVLHESARLPVDGVFYDLGISSHQIDTNSRGFSFQGNGPLDMRFNPDQQTSAATIVNHYEPARLEKLIREYGEERRWRAIVREIVARRSIALLKTTGDLADAVRTVVGERMLHKTLARVFQAIRIEVNQELARLEKSLQLALNMLREGGRLVVISYHSLEDRIVKSFFREKSRDCTCPPELPQCVCDTVQELRVLTRKPVLPDSGEIAANPRARSAKLRAAEKVVPYAGESI